MDQSATEALACGLLGTDRVPPELLARLPESTQGNPLFVRELVRMLVDDGVLLRSNGTWVTTIDVDAIEVPPTIHSLLAARVDRLDQAERTMLELASVIGKEFYRGAVDELAPASVRVSLDAHLESLRRKEFIEPAGTYWIDEPVFRFHHVLIRDAAYRRLLKEARAELHELAAGWLERKTAGVLGEHDELIGYHYEQAHESLRQLKAPGAERDEHAQELERRAAHHLSAAARSALDRDDVPAAAALSRRALERLDHDNPDRGEILIVHCEALLAVGDVVAADPPVQELERIAEEASDGRLKAWATLFEFEERIVGSPSRLPEMEERAREAADVLSSLGDRAGAAKAHTVHATILASLGRVTECEVALDAALTAAREAGDRRRITDVISRAMTATLWGPSPVSRAGGRCLDLVRLSRITTNPPEVEATSLRCQAVLEAFRGRADAGRRMLRSARRSLEELGRPYGILQTELFAGVVELTDGRPDAAAEHLESAYEGLRGMGVQAHAARAGALLG
ncbi:MAG: ATP-binding protein, partial [Candidatus Binatia bacterium]